MNPSLSTAQPPPGNLIISCALSSELAAEYTEVEAGKVESMPELLAAMKHADLVGAKLLVEKLDRLSRDLHF